jgi:apolipoprotein N-acyltransferase
MIQSVKRFFYQILGECRVCLPWSLFSALTGLFLFCVCTPRDWHYLHWFAFLPLFLACRQASRKRNFYIGWCGGLSANFLIFLWIIPTVKDFGGIPLPLGAFLLFLMAGWGAVLYGLLGMVVPWFRQVFPRLWMLFIPAFFTFTEYLFPNIFPYFQGCGQFKNLPILQCSSFLTISGVTFLVLLGNCMLYEALLSLRLKEWKKAILLPLLFLLLWGGVWYHGTLRIRAYETAILKAPRLKVAMAQTGWHIEQIHSKTFPEIWSAYIGFTKEAIQRGAELILWPESAMGISYAHHDLYRQVHEVLLPDLAKKHKIALIYGGNFHHSEFLGRLNSAFFIDNTGKREVYHKMILVPFGEYLPFSQWFPSLKGKIQGVQDVEAGKERKIFHLTLPTTTSEGDPTFPQSLAFATIICYEAIFHSSVRAFLQDGAKLLVNLTADSWFKKTDAPYQHLMLSSLSAVQLGVGLLRSTDSGITAYIDPLGRVHQPSPLFVPHLWFEEIPLYHEETFVKKYGFWFPYTCFFFCLFIVCGERKNLQKSLKG